MKKRGISDLIATVLIIGFVIVIGIGVFVWSSSFIKNLQERSEEKASEYLRSLTIGQSIARNETIYAVNCSIDTDCGQNYIEEYYCKENNIYRDYTNYTCLNPRQPNSNCKVNVITILVDSCNNETEHCIEKQSECQPIICKNCNECGSGLFNVCDRTECENCLGKCYFISGLITNDCYSCSNITGCGKYDNDKITCINDPCKIGNCSWDNGCIVNETICTITCSTNFNCNQSYWSNSYCYNDYIYKDYINYSCIYPNTCNSYCNFTKNSYLIKDCQTGFVNGHCINNVCQEFVNQTISNITINCTDTDGGINYYIKGTTTFGPINGKMYNATDGCDYSGKILSEHYCSYNYGKYTDTISYYECPNGSCINGACVNGTSRPTENNTLSKVIKFKSLTGQPTINYNGSCIDTDNGVNYELEGCVYSKNMFECDECIQTNYPKGVIERYCDLEGLGQSSYTECPLGTLCVIGACVPESGSPPCTDTDSGKNYYIQGYVNVPGYRWDVCTDGKTLYENYCGPIKIAYTCPNSCYDGACV